jgi:hypothetical protein
MPMRPFRGSVRGRGRGRGRGFWIEEIITNTIYCELWNKYILNIINKYNSMPKL